ncbi:hypothetical protein TRFO_33516 [Tritrichomonas foetus]|uniref:Uncharacterized protein n=1 Tax=Tritrichomonas foetus TaxID=1144522 RepID=A0A1J4JNE3_9EUKA|nr:hypothetical protein TRFO_33516 [Tritrichomonas foetus]|eukprot:OHS99951.1 hypothetical protein TRFO_33516 [Tritrichomonas foetus]
MLSDFLSAGSRTPRSRTPKACHTFMEDNAFSVSPFEITSDSESDNYSFNNNISNNFQNINNHPNENIFTCPYQNLSPPRVIDEPVVPPLRRNFLPPILAQSPRLKDEDDEDFYPDDDIYPTDSLMAKFSPFSQSSPQNSIQLNQTSNKANSNNETNLNNINNTNTIFNDFESNDETPRGMSTKFGQARLLDFNSPNFSPVVFNTNNHMNNNVHHSNLNQNLNNETDYLEEDDVFDKPIPPELTTPSKLLVEIQLHEAKVNLRNAVSEWKQKVLKLKANSKQKMEQLLAKHADELSSFDKINGFGRMNTSPQLLELIDIQNMEPSVYRVRTISSQKRTNTPNQFRTAEFNNKRKKLVERHKHEIIALNTECAMSLKALEEKRDADIEMKKKVMQELASNAPANGAVKPSFSGIDFNATLKISNQPLLIDENGEVKGKYFRISQKDESKENQ